MRVEHDVFLIAEKEKFIHITHARQHTHRERDRDRDIVTHVGYILQYFLVDSMCMTLKYEKALRFGYTYYCIIIIIILRLFNITSNACDAITRAFFFASSSLFVHSPIRCWIFILPKWSDIRDIRASIHTHTSVCVCVCGMCESTQSLAQLHKNRLHAYTQRGITIIITVII